MLGSRGDRDNKFKLGVITKMKKLLAAAVLGASLLAINVGTASAATNCPFSNGLQNLGSNLGTNQAANQGTSQLNLGNSGNLNNFIQQLLGQNNNGNVSPVQQSNAPVQQSNCPLQQQ
jgi:hypothetical protein